MSRVKNRNLHPCCHQLYRGDNCSSLLWHQMCVCLCVCVCVCTYIDVCSLTFLAVRYKPMDRHICLIMNNRNSECISHTDGLKSPLPYWSHSKAEDWWAGSPLMLGSAAFTMCSTKLTCVGCLHRFNLKSKQHNKQHRNKPGRFRKVKCREMYQWSFNHLLKLAEHRQKDGGWDPILGWKLVSGSAD